MSPPVKTATPFIDLKTPYRALRESIDARMKAVLDARPIHPWDPRCASSKSGLRGIQARLTA